MALRIIYMKGLVRKTTRVLFCGQVEGKEAPGPLFDFGLLMFHCGKALFEHKSGPFFYLSKVTHVQTYICSNMLMISFIWVCTVILCSVGGGLHGGQTLEQNICLDTAEGLHYFWSLCINLFLYYVLCFWLVAAVHWPYKH